MHLICELHSKQPSCEQPSTKTKKYNVAIVNITLPALYVILYKEELGLKYQNVYYFQISRSSFYVLIAQCHNM
jgi:hypothetical protein